MTADFSEVFSRTQRVSSIGTAVVERRIEADAGERAALAALFRLPGIARLSGDFTLSHESGGVIAAMLRLAARVTQVCVVSLEAFETEVREDAALRFVPAASVKEGAEVELDPEALDGPDEIIYGGEVIDLGAVLAEQLALALEPYPRKPGAVLEMEDETAGENPFAVLRKWGKEGK